MKNGRDGFSVMPVFSCVQGTSYILFKIKFGLELEEGTVRNIKILTLATAGIAIFFLTTSVIAAVALPNGWYAEINAGSGKTHVSGSGSQTVSNSGFGGGVNAGYKFMPFFAGEIGYTKYPIAYTKVSGVKIAKETLYSYDLAAKGILPISDTGLNLFAKLGLARASGHVVNTNPSVGTVSNPGTSTITTYLFGAGGEFSVLPNLAVNVQWNRVKGKSAVKDLDLLSAGLTYIFS
jgi:hypothetical protein